jgi:hypothetical protein
MSAENHKPLSRRFFEEVCTKADLDVIHEFVTFTITKQGGEEVRHD